MKEINERYKGYDMWFRPPKIQAQAGVAVIVCPEYSNNIIDVRLINERIMVLEMLFKCEKYYFIVMPALNDNAENNDKDYFVNVTRDNRWDRKRLDTSNGRP